MPAATASDRRVFRPRCSLARVPSRTADTRARGTSVLDVTRALLAVLDGSVRTAAALATVIERSGSAPQIVGARLLLHDDGRQVGTVGGGAIEAEVIAACRSALRDGNARRIRHNLVRDLGMCCGGTMEVLVEFVQPMPRLLVIGGGHVSQALVPLATTAGFRVAVFDDREEMLEHPAFAGVDVHLRDVDELDTALDDLDDRDYVVILTRDHARDERALAQLIGRPHRYLGMIGSRRKVVAVLRRILHRRPSTAGPPDLSRVRAPIGLSLGGRTPAEIAISIVAELVADRHGGSGVAMNTVGSFVDLPSTNDGDDAAPDSVDEGVQADIGAAPPGRDVARPR